jgi:mono/diheme cytochrome c family protein
MKAKVKVIHAFVLCMSVLPAQTMADTGHHADHYGKAGMPSMEHHWMAPAEAAGRRNPIPAERASLERGKKLFQANCVSCHDAQGRGDGPVAVSLNPKPADLTAMAGHHPDGDYAWKIANGRGAMPAWKGSLTENQIWDLVNFIQSLGVPTVKER